MKYERIAAISQALELFAVSKAITPDPIIKPFLMATIDFTERMKNGEQPSFPPELSDASTIGEYASWLNRVDMVLPNDFQDYYAKIIG